MKTSIFHSASHRGLEVRTLVEHHEIHKHIDKRVFDIVAEKIAEDLYNQHKDYILSNMSLKSLIKCVYKRASKMVEDKIMETLG